MKRTRTPIPWLAAGLAAACSADLGKSTATHLESAPHYTLREEIRIGSSSDPNIGFTQIVGVDLDREGNVYAFDSRESEFRVFSGDGRFLRKIGRRGEGPGEFTSSPTFGITGDTLWALERLGVDSRKLTLFSLQGDVISTGSAAGVRVRLQGERGTGIVYPYSFRDGFFHGRMLSFASSRPEDPPAPGLTDTIQVPRVRWDLSGKLVDTIGWYDYPPLAQRGGLTSIRPGGRYVIVPRPLAEQTITIALASGVVVIDNSSPNDAASAATRISRLRGKGDTVFSRAFTYDAVPYDEAALAALAWRNARTGGSIPIIDGVATPRPTPPDSLVAYTALRAAMQFPNFQHPFQQSLVGEDESIWLSRYNALGGGNWLVFNKDGTLRGQLTLPPRARILRIDGDEVWGASPDDMDVAWLVRYHLERAAAER